MKAVLCLLFLFAAGARAQAIPVKSVEVACKGGSECEGVEGALDFLAREYTDINHLKNTMRLYAMNDGIKSLEYELDQENGVYQLKVVMEVKNILMNYSVYTEKDPGLDLPTVLPVREGDFVDDRALEKTRALLKEVLGNQGYPDAQVGFKQSKDEDGIELDINLLLGKPILVDEIRITSDSKVLEEIAQKAFGKLEGKNFYLQRIKNSMEELRQLYIGYGYYLNELSLNYDLPSKHTALVNVTIKSNGLHVFYPKGNMIIGTSELKNVLKNSVLAYKRQLPEDIVLQRVRNLYAEKGFIDVESKVELKNYKNLNGELVNHYTITLKENERTKIERIRFNGNSALSGKVLRAAFFREAPAVVKSGYFQRDYVENFVQVIREEYITRGYVNIMVEEPRVQIVEGQAFLNYRIREGVKAVVSKVVIDGVPEEMETEFKGIITTQEKKFFNPVTFKKDLEIIENRLRQQGYYFASILNKTSKNIVAYKNDNSTVEIDLDIDLGERLLADQIIIIGNRKTRSKLIRRELEIENGDLVTREKIQNSQTNLLGLGIFSSVLIEPVPSANGKSDILVSVREKDFGVVELAPGIRTDIGVKVSGNITYNNLDGMNKRISLKGQINQRFNLNSLDERRREESNSLIEYDLATNYAENNIFDSEVDFSASLSSSRKRFFSFDADIQRINFTFNREFTPWFSTALRPQFENIEQFDATSPADEGTFQIGSLTPGVTFDFRNNRINPTSGAWFNVNVEVANPALLSQQTDELTINYYKTISRNRFYIPFKNGTLAMSLAAGIEENLAKNGEGYIPNIKVFRLNGVDIVRGFEDDEINRLPNGQDISEVTVDDKAYMAVLKIEPRFFLSDTTMLGVFYDAGRVFVNEFDPDDLRSSVGITFKYLTPVGSLDFDYGIKLLRKTYDDGMVDSPGRLHVSIGFF